MGRRVSWAIVPVGGIGPGFRNSGDFSTRANKLQEDMVIYRIYSSKDGETHKEVLDVVPKPRKDLSEMQRLGVVNKRKATSVGFVNQQPGFVAPLHAVGTPVMAIIMSGRVEYGCSDGSKFIAGPGDVIVCEDVAGKGHSVKVLGNEPRASVVVQLE